ncbi:MAG: NAD-dependent deacylase [Thermoplasmata archaeon]|nr:MAG: NAD-dependent deacylase [Thermoplasmata archaeon]
MIKKAAKDIAKAKMAIALTGAGISTESGIPDFRSKDGLWSKYDINEYGHIDSFKRNPGKVWRMLREMISLLDAKPNPAHYALAELEKMGYIKAVITQNVDNLHQEAGSKNVIEFHGNFKRVVCLKCGKKQDVKKINMQNLPPYCNCGGVLKPDGIFFGEPIPREAYSKSIELATQCDLMLVIGTSATVYPASQLPYFAKGSLISPKGIVIEINKEATEITGIVSDYIIEGKAGEILSQIVKEIKSFTS